MRTHKTYDNHASNEAYSPFSGLDSEPPEICTVPEPAQPPLGAVAIGLIAFLRSRSRSAKQRETAARLGSGLPISI